MSPSQAFKQKLHDIIQEVMEEADIWKTCINCKSFNEDQELCKLCVPASRPPARVIAFGCPHLRSQIPCKLNRNNLPHNANFKA